MMQGLKTHDPSCMPPVPALQGLILDPESKPLERRRLRLHPHSPPGVFLAPGPLTFHSMDLTSAPGSKGISKPSAGTALGQPGHKRSSVWEEGLEETRVNHKRKPVGTNGIVTVCISATSDPQLPEVGRSVDISH